MRVRVRDTVLFFDVAGAKFTPDGDALLERPTLVLIHGGPGGDHAAYKPALDSLADVAQLVYLDLRGHGRSDAGTPAEWTLASWADDLAAFCDALDISTPVVLGASWGVAVVATYAARHPQQPGKLIFSGGAARRDPEIELAAVERIAGKAARELGERYFRDQTPANEDAYDAAIRPFVSGRPPEDHTLRRISPAAPGLMEHWDAGEARTHDLRPGLADVICPTLILAGEQDPVCPWELSLELAQAIDPKLCRLEILPEGKHTLFYEAPQSLTLIRDFLLS